MPPARLSPWRRMRTPPRLSEAAAPEAAVSSPPGQRTTRRRRTTRDKPPEVAVPSRLRRTTRCRRTIRGKPPEAALPSAAGTRHRKRPCLRRPCLRRQGPIFSSAARGRLPMRPPARSPAWSAQGQWPMKAVSVDAQLRLELRDRDERAAPNRASPEPGPDLTDPTLAV